MADKNLILNEIENKTYNAGVTHILRHTSVALRRFGGKYKNKVNFYSDRLSILYNQWQDDLGKYKDGMTHADLKKGKTYEQFIKLTEIGVVSEMISHQIMKQALGSPEATAEFIADKIEVAAARAAFEIDKLFIEEICKDANYATEAKTEKDADDYKGEENVRNLLKEVRAKATAMRWPSKKFNKMGLVSASLDFKKLGVIVSENLDAEAADYYSQVTNLEKAELEKRFAWIEVLPIQEKGKELILIDDNGFVLELDEEAPTGWDLTRKAFLETWHYKWVFAYLGMAKGYNSACWTKKTTI